MANPPRCKNLVLDAGPLLSLSPLRGLAETYLTVPQVLAELKDKRAREHFERLGLSSGVKIEVKSPDAASLAHVTQFAKKTGDYAVLSHPDLCVLALTWSLHQRAKEEAEKASSEAAQENTDTSKTEPLVEDVQPEAKADVEAEPETEIVPETQETTEDEPNEENLEPLDVELLPVTDNPTAQSEPPIPSTPEAIYDDPSDSDDGEGDWITPANVGLYKSRALDLLPDVDAKGKGKGKGKADEVIAAGCMTGDFAMQNVLLQMGLSLVGVEGKRIEKVKSWVLRCHACFKVCKDSSKKFCPSCGNPTLLRASVTIASPTASASTPAMQIHLKANFQYKVRGTKYPIPAPKAGSAKKGPGEGLVLREDQNEWLRAQRKVDGKREKEDRRVTKGILGRPFDGDDGGAMVGVGSWMDPDWMPEMLSVGSGGKGRSIRSGGMNGDMPVIGYGRKNPNERRKKK